MIFLRVYWRMKGEHIHCRVFVTREGVGEFAHCGNLVLHAAEFIALTQGKIQPEFIEETDGEPAR